MLATDKSESTTQPPASLPGCRPMMEHIARRNEAEATYTGLDPSGTSVWQLDPDEAARAGATRARLAAEWAGYLEENGCTYDQPCEP